tara:strand:- start:2626 stop:3057 length:432 start_codon:yes stop_codon:yes gene_type:complete
VSELISLTLTVPTIILSAWVVIEYGRPAVKALRGILAGSEVTTEQLLILGISVGFIGAFFDNIYWGFAWLADYTGHPWRDLLFNGGVFANIPFRQGAGILAACLHLYAAGRGAQINNNKKVVYFIAALTAATTISLISAYAPK